MGEGSQGVPPARRNLIDVTVPNAARTADYLLGGTDNFATDREMVRAMTAFAPVIERNAVEGRAFRRRAVTFLAAEAGLRQFLDVGVGMVTPGVTHEAAQAADPCCRVAYIAGDAMVLSRAQARIGAVPGGAVSFMAGDVADVDALLAGAATIMDLGQPTAVLLSTLTHVTSLASAAAVVSALLAAVPRGSWLAIDHLASDLDPALAAAVREWNKVVVQPVTARSRGQMLTLVAGLEVASPGVVPVTAWRPGPAASSVGEAAVPVYGVVARKP